jgi:hypothetical protein
VVQVRPPQPKNPQSHSGLGIFLWRGRDFESIKHPIFCIGSTVFLVDKIPVFYYNKQNNNKGVKSDEEDNSFIERLNVEHTIVCLRKDHDERRDDGVCP